jgi:hypothetical protein
MEDNSSVFRFEMNFYKVLSSISKKISVYINIPDTILLGYGFKTPTFFTTDPDSGSVVIKKRLTPDAIKEIFAYFEEDKTDGLFPIAVLRTGGNPTKDYSKVLFSAHECLQKWQESTSKNISIQKYIKNGNILSLIKSSWDNIASKSTLKELIKHKNVKYVYKNQKKKNLANKRKSILKELRFKDNREIYQIVEEDKNYVINDFNMHILERKLVYLVNLIEKYYLFDRNMKIISIDVDWIQDSSGNVYLINVKNYRIAEIEGFKNKICLFNVPKVDLTKFSLEKPRPFISLSKKLRKNLFSKSFSIFPRRDRFQSQFQ